MATKKAPSKGKSAARKKAATKKTQSKAVPKGEGLFYQFRREIMGALCLLLALLIFLSSLDKTSALAKLFMGLVGETGLYVLPLGLVLCSVALFSHGGSSSAAIGQILNLPIPYVCAVLHLNFTGITILKLDRSSGLGTHPCLELSNDARHIAI